jgi:putative nucleotidyltransferase with HDIG domain
MGWIRAWSHKTMDTLTLVFDWGDTLMANIPGQDGSMANWPVVAAVEDADAALTSLSSRYPCILATNASDSRSEDVKMALARVGLDEHFKAIFTSRELGFRKPEIGFFRGLQSVLGLDPDHLVMIGDDYRGDMLGAKMAGWRCLWYNPSGKTAPSLLPTHDAEVSHLADLPGRFNEPFPPGYALCLSWLQDQQLPQDLLTHIYAVASTAYLLAAWLKAAGQVVDPVLVHRGGLMHDLAKMKAMEGSSEERIDHGELAARLLLERGEPALAECARRHGLFALIQPDLAPRTWEEKLVFFADKLVEGSRIAGLDERIVSLRRRYAHNSEKIAAMAPALFTLQDEVCAALGFPAGELIDRIKTAFYSG